MNKIVIIECCNYIDYPTGGQLTFAKNLLSSFKEDLVLIGLAHNADDVGKWKRITINSIEYDYFGYLFLKKNEKKPFIPLRLRNYVALKKYWKQILSYDFENVIVQSPDTFLAIYNWKIPNICYRFSGIENQLAISRYKVARLVAFLYDRMFLPKLKYAKKILAAADSQAINELILRSKGTLNHESIIQFPTRINTEIFQKKSKEYCRKKINSNSSDILIVNTGRLAEFKGWEFMINSFTIFRVSVPNSRFFIIGNGEDFEKINKYIYSIKMQDYIYLLGYLPPNKIAEYLNAADIFIMGSYKEGWSTSLIEAVACGVPACVTNFSSAKDVIENGINGFVAEMHDENSFAELMYKSMKINRINLPRKIDVEKYSIINFKNELLKLWSLIPK